MINPTPPKVSLLHFHPTGQPSEWIKKLASQLIAAGIDVQLDAWELKLGQDVYAYKEKAINNPFYKHVLLVFDEAYYNRVQAGTAEKQLETQLTRMEIYQDVKQTRIIPIVHLKQEHKNLLPLSIRSRHFLDFSNYENAQLHLLHTIYQVSSKPDLGNTPVNLEPFYFSAAPYLDIIQQQPTRINQQGRLFFEDFLAKMRQVSGNYEYLKTAWKEFLEYVSIKDLEPSFNAGSLIECLEELGKMKQEEEREENFSLVVHELFLMAIAIGFKARNFSFLGNLLQGNYIGVQAENSSFVVFNVWSATALSQWKIERAGAITEQLQQQMTPHFSIEQLVEADLLCHYIALMKQQTWIPFFAPYIKATTYPISWLKKLSIKKFFHKTKQLYGVEQEKDFEKSMNRAYLHFSQLEFWPYTAVYTLEQVIPRKIAVLD